MPYEAFTIARVRRKLSREVAMKWKCHEKADAQDHKGEINREGFRLVGEAVL